MDFEISHRFGADLDEVARVLLDADYQQSLSGVGALSERRVLDQREMADGSVRRRVRCVLRMDVAGTIRKFLGNADPAWVEDALWYPEKHLWEWRIVPEVGAELLTSHGWITLRGRDGTTERLVAGTVRVRVPLYGGRVEGIIVDGLRRAYEEEALHLAAWLGPDVTPP